MMKQSVFRRLLSGIADFLPHLLMSYSWIILTCAAITVVNEPMELLCSHTSRHFELVFFAAAILTAITAFIRKRCRIPAVIACAVGIAFLVPLVQAMSADSARPLITTYFKAISGIFGIAALVFSVMMIVSQRRAAKQSA